MSGKTNKLKLVIMTAIVMVSTIAIVFVAYYKGIFLPKWCKWSELTIEGDYGEPETFVLSNKTLRVYKNSECIFESPKGCLVQNILWCDIDRDSVKELLVLNYNVGRFGSHKPFWVKGNDRRLYQHIYIYRYDEKENRMRAIWMASDIGMDAADFCTLDNGIIEITDKNGNKTRWSGSEFGLKYVD